MVATAGAALHFAMLPGNEAAFLAYLNETRPDGEQVPAHLMRALVSKVHDLLAPDCDMQLGVE